MKVTKSTCVSLSRLLQRSYPGDRRFTNCLIDLHHKNLVFSRSAVGLNSFRFILSACRYFSFFFKLKILVHVIAKLRPIIFVIVLVLATVLKYQPSERVVSRQITRQFGHSRARQSLALAKSKTNKQTKR